MKAEIFGWVLGKDEMKLLELLEPYVNVKKQKKKNFTKNWKKQYQNKTQR